MPRVKRGTAHVKKRRTLLKKVKGYKWGRKKLVKRAKTAVLKAGVHAYIDRKNKKRTRRALWQIKLGAWAKENDLSYSKLMGLLKAGKVELDRKVLADLAENNPAVIKALVDQIKK